MFIVDAHLDLAYNALKHDRDPLQPVAALRAREKSDDPRGRPTVAFPQLREAGVGLVFGTLFTMPRAAVPLMGGEERMTYLDPRQAHRLAMDQLDYYRRLADEEANSLRLVGNRADLESVVKSHAADEEGQPPLIGILPLMEGADPVVEPEELEIWIEKGLRMIGPAWDDTRYAAGAWRGSREGLTREGYHLLEVMADYNLILDVTHMNEQGVFQALDSYAGPVAATHSNARALVPGERQLGDEQIRLLGARDGVIGVVLYNRFLHADYRKGDPKEMVTLDHVVAHIDHICQLLGDARHVGLGTDLDGGFGAADIPLEMDSAADLPLIAERLLSYGYAASDIANVMGQNWLDFLRRALPD